MTVTPEHVATLLALQEELLVRGYQLDAQHSKCCAFVADPAVRRKARELLPAVMADVEKHIGQALPDAQFTVEQAKPGQYVCGLAFDGRDKGIRGMVRISEITAERGWGLNLPVFAVVELPHLALAVAVWYVPDQMGVGDEIRETKRISTAVWRAIEPLRQLDGAPRVRPTRAMPDLAPPATQPALELQHGPAIERDSARAEGPLKVDEDLTVDMKPVSPGPGHTHWLKAESVRLSWEWDKLHAKIGLGGTDVDPRYRWKLRFETVLKDGRTYARREVAVPPAD